MAIKKIEAPSFITGGEVRKKYKKWLYSKADSHYKRDSKIHNNKFSKSDYRIALHEAVKLSEGLDHYTGKKLDWHLIGSWDNKKAKEIQGYKRKFKNLPTLEHVYREDVSITLEFVICGWAVNDAKNDLSIDEFIELCKEVVEYHENK